MVDKVYQGEMFEVRKQGISHEKEEYIGEEGLPFKYPLRQTAGIFKPPAGLLA
jgi:hypothetical protein